MKITTASQAAKAPEEAVVISGGKDLLTPSYIFFPCFSTQISEFPLEKPSTAPLVFL